METHKLVSPPVEARHAELRFPTFDQCQEQYGFLATQQRFVQCKTLEELFALVGRKFPALKK